MSTGHTVMDSTMLVTKFYENQDIFITGASGFIGKALIEKLLRSCPTVGNVYVLIRNKKGKDIHERIQHILSTALFKLLRKEQPQTLAKVIPIAGDCSELGLGISPEDLQKLENVSVIFHSAASVRFDDPLRASILLNTRGTHELIKIAETLQNLKIFVHVSTTYCNPDKQTVEEKIYPPYADWRTTLKLAEKYDAGLLNIFFKKYGNNQPNTYTFTKSLAEQIVNDYRHRLPVVIFRPSIVISTIEEPIPGWADNFNGPLGMLVACGVGILRTNYADPDIVSDFVPVDVVVKAMLLCAYFNGIKERSLLDDDLTIVNCAVSNFCPITQGEVIDIGKEYIKENPFEKTLWIPGGSITRCWFWNFIRFITLHLMMAIIVDTLLRLTKEKPFLLKLQRRIYAANIALHFFVTRSWDFKNANFIELDALVPEEEKSKFCYMHHTNLDYVQFFRNGIRGAKEFLLNESPDATKAARIRLRIFQVIHYCVQTTGIFFIARYVYHFICNWLMQFPILHAA